MPNTLTTAQLETAKTMITNGNLVGFYNYLSNQGYGYANLAKGVVECSLWSGGSTAQNHMIFSAAQQGINLTDTQVKAVEVAMANQYVDTLINLSVNAGGVVNRDWNFQEALNGHINGLESLGLPRNLWTLYTPSQILDQAQLESNWNKTIDPSQADGFTPAVNFTFGFAKDAGEVQGLSSLGITSLNYAMGTFEQNGTLRQLASPDLTADTYGIRTHVVPEGIVVETSNGDISLLTTHIDDKSLLEANRDGVTSYEDIKTIISTADFYGPAIAPRCGVQTAERQIAPEMRADCVQSMRNGGRFDSRKSPAANERF